MSVGEGVVIDMDKEIAEKTVGILSCLEKRNIELDIEEVGKRKINLVLWRLIFLVSVLGLVRECDRLIYGLSES